MKPIFCIVLILISAQSIAFAGSAQHKPSAKTATADQVSAFQRAHGPQGTVDWLFKSGAWESSLLPGVKAAQPDWLELVRTLHPSADAGAGEDLDAALAQALLKDPYRVLPLLKEFWWSQSDTACTFDYDSELPGGVQQYVQRLRVALERTPPAQIVHLREACIRGINATLLALRKNAPQG